MPVIVCVMKVRTSLICSVGTYQPNMEAFVNHPCFLVIVRKRDVRTIDLLVWACILVCATPSSKNTHT